MTYCSSSEFRLLFGGIHLNNRNSYNQTNAIFQYSTPVQIVISSASHIHLCINIYIDSALPHFTLSHCNIVYISSTIVAIMAVRSIFNSYFYLPPNYIRGRLRIQVRPSSVRPSVRSSVRSIISMPQLPFSTKFYTVVPYHSTLRMTKFGQKKFKMADRRPF